jgi:alkylated DNA repair dioxygenase AlkB
MAEAGIDGAMTQEVEDGGLLRYWPAFYAPAEADALFASLREHVAWKQERGRFGRPFPRLTALYGDPGLTYTYSGVSYPALPWSAELEAVRRRVEAAAQAPLNSVLLNRYRGGDDSMGFHADDEPELGRNPVVPSLSLGAPRCFVLRHNATRRRLEYVLGHGSLLVMAGTLQHFWQHALPRTRQPVGERINLTFRQIAAG